MKLKRFIIGLTFLLAAGAQAATVTFDPNPKTVGLGSLFTLNIVGTGFPETEGGGAEFTFDESILQVNSVTVDSAVWEIFTSPGNIDNLNGTVDGIVVATFIDPGVSFTVASIVFEAIGIGTTALPLSENPLNLWAAAGSPINPTMTAGSVTVLVPVPPAVWLFGSALGLMGWIRSRAAQR